MHKLTPVEDAKALFEEAKNWGVWRWLTEKKRARTTADAAWEALEEYEKKVKSAWGDEPKRAYLEAEAEAAVDGKAKSKKALDKAREEAKDIDPDVKAAMKKLKAADDEAYQMRMTAEATFDEADRRLSTSMAREGAQQAIDAWDMREKFIRKAESIGRRK